MIYQNVEANLAFAISSFFLPLFIGPQQSVLYEEGLKENTNILEEWR